MKKVYSWFRTTSNKNKSLSSSSSTNNQINQNKLYGITDDLINHIQSFTLETFKNFNLQDEEQEEGMINNGGGESNVQKDLSDWQEKHALLVLSTVKELSQLRFRLCPRYLKEGQFWRIYFTLVKNYVAKYELHAIRLETLKQIEIENKKDSNTGAYEVEMLEARKPESLEPEDSLV
uniref:uncharacterized protein LOC122582800 n=1 Tax=Erigeron canadensis TaxID=72917 RepID=UPI001CB97268|nr:uncharacterized protein LOC122582800 [Erigeron canadensis]